MVVETWCSALLSKLKLRLARPNVPEDPAYAYRLDGSGIACHPEAALMEPPGFCASRPIRNITRF
jgi:hypothetical protein